MKEKPLSTDIKKFIEKFDPVKFKPLADGIEIRGITNIHRSMSRANELIDRLQLNLKIVHNAEMLVYGAFEVKVA